MSEKEWEGEDHESYVRRIAQLKADHVASRKKEAWVIGADTIVVVGEVKMGKPATGGEARKMLQLLSGKKHVVMTGVALICANQHYCESVVEKTEVWFKTITPSEIEQYISTPEPYDKAGSYGIQGKGATFVDRIEGEVSNVMGLPLRRIKILLENSGILNVSHKN